MTKPFNENTSITNEEINQLPLGAFEGKIVIISDSGKLAEAFEEISTHHYIGFDTETKPVFVRGHHNKVAILQIALPEKVFLIRLMATGITPEMIKFLQDEEIKKAGVAIRDDIKALQHLHRFNPGGFIELAHLSKESGLEVESVKKLTALLLGFRISKSAQGHLSRFGPSSCRACSPTEVPSSQCKARQACAIDDRVSPAASQMRA